MEVDRRTFLNAGALAVVAGAGAAGGAFVHKRISGHSGHEADVLMTYKNEIGEWNVGLSHPDDFVEVLELGIAVDPKRAQDNRGNTVCGLSPEAVVSIVERLGSTDDRYRGLRLLSNAEWDAVCNGPYPHKDFAPTGWYPQLGDSMLHQGHMELTSARVTDGRTVEDGGKTVTKELPFDGVVVKRDDDGWPSGTKRFDDCVHDPKDLYEGAFRLERKGTVYIARGAVYGGRFARTRMESFRPDEWSNSLSFRVVRPL